MEVRLAQSGNVINDEKEVEYPNRQYHLLKAVFGTQILNGPPDLPQVNSLFNCVHTILLEVGGSKKGILAKV
jgi:hypothetical protein